MAIYELINPTNNDVFYIGHTSDPHRRLATHISKATKACRMGYWRLPKTGYIVSLILDHKVKPKMRVIDSVGVGRKEKQYIQEYINNGHNLMNFEANYYQGNVDVFTKPYFFFYRDDVYEANSLERFALMRMSAKYLAQAIGMYRSLTGKYSDTPAKRTLQRHTNKLQKKLSNNDFTGWQFDKLPS